MIRLENLLLQLEYRCFVTSIYILEIMMRLVWLASVLHRSLGIIQGAGEVIGSLFMGLMLCVFSKFGLLSRVTP